MKPKRAKAVRAWGNNVYVLPDEGAVESVGTWLSMSDENHLRRLVAWVRGDVGLTPEEIVDTVNRITDKTGEPSEDAKARLVAWHRQSSAVPKYIRAAVKALEKTMARGRK